MASTIVLVRKAQAGDSAAQNDLIQRFYQDWVDRFHGDLGTTIRKLYDTSDLVQSAVTDVLRDLPALRNEAVFYTWVTSIIRHKIAAHRRRLRREVALEGAWETSGGCAALLQDAQKDAREPEETYLETLDAILDLFPEHPEEMAALVLKFLDGHSIPYLVELLGASQRTVFRRLRDGTAFLKKRLGA